MKPTNAKSRIIDCTVPLLARHGYAGTTMRSVAAASGVKASVIYHYFTTKDDLLREVRAELNARLDAAFDGAPAAPDAAALLRQRLALNLEHRQDIVALLQYFMAVKADFPPNPGGYVPPRAYRHMRQIIDTGISEGRYSSADPDFDAKVLAHMVNGFLLEFFPHDLPAVETEALVEKLANFIERSLAPRQEVNA